MNKDILKHKFSTPLSLIFYTIFIYGFLFVLSYFLLILTNLTATKETFGALNYLFSGLGFILLIPVSGIPISVFLAVSVILYQKTKWQIIKSGLASFNLIILVVAALWVPNSIIQWPTHILGDHESKSLIRRVFPRHIVPPEKAFAMYGDRTFDWQVTEFYARLAIFFAIWTFFLVIVYFIYNNKKRSHKT